MAATEPATTGEQPCQCHESHAAVVAFHSGHCCFFPASQTCHADEVAKWEADHARLNGSTS